jgi:hypothetical protein
MTFGDLTNMRNAPARKSNKKQHKNVKRVEFEQPEFIGRSFALLKPDQWATFCSLPKDQRREYIESVRVENNKP